MGLRWSDTEDIALTLMDAHPGVNPLTVRFTDLHRWITELVQFEDDPKTASEAKLEAIQMAWLAEFEDSR